MAFGSRPVTNEQAVALGLEDGSSGSASSPIPHQQAVQLGLEEDSLTPPPESDSFIKGGIWTGGLKPLGQGVAAMATAPWQEQRSPGHRDLGLIDTFKENAGHTVGDIKGFLGMLYDPMEAEWGKAFQAQREGRGLGEFMYRGLAGSVPLVGPMLGKALDTGIEGRPREAVGQAMVGLPLQFAVPELVGRVPGALGKISESSLGTGTKAALGKAGMKAVAREFPVIGPAIREGMKAVEQSKIAKTASEAARPGSEILPGAGDLATETANKLRMMKAAREAMPGGIGLEEGAGTRALSAAEKLRRVQSPPPATTSSTSLQPAELPPPPTGAPSVNTSGTASYPQVTIQAEELPRPPIGNEVADFAEWIKNNRRSRSNPSPWDDPQVLEQEAVNAALDAGKRVEAQGAGHGSGFEPGLDQPTPRWNPLVNKITDPVSGETINGTFDPRTGTIVPTTKTLPKPPEFATFEPDELVGVEDFLKRTKGKKVLGSNTMSNPEANIEVLAKLDKTYGSRVPEGVPTKIDVDMPGISGKFIVYKHGGKLTDYAWIDSGELRGRLRGGYHDPKLASPGGMKAIMDELWKIRDQWKLNPNSMSEGSIKSWMKYKPTKKS